MADKTCPQCAETVKAEAKICRFCNYNFETGTPGDTRAAPVQPAKNKGLGKGCLVVLGIFVVLVIIGAIAGGDQKTAANNNADGKVQAAETALSSEGQAEADEAPASSLTGPQQNAARTAQQYISMSGFSRKGLIEQLSSDAGNGYDVADATAAVDSLNIDYNEQAVRTAKQYLDMSGFSCKGLIEQLSSSAGNDYTVSEATYGAKQAGGC